MTKNCSICGKEKNLEDFRKSPICRNGRSGWCKKCAGAYCTAWKRKNAKHIAAQRRKRYAETQGMEVKERERRRRARTPLRVQCQRMRSAMHEAHKNRGIVFELNALTTGYLMERIESKPFCECCGVPFAIGVNNGANVKCSGVLGIRRENAPSVDRVIPSKGYTKKNIAILCWRCNRIKCDATPQELVRLSEWLVQRAGKEAHG